MTEVWWPPMGSSTAAPESPMACDMRSAPSSAAATRSAAPSPSENPIIVSVRNVPGVSVAPASAVACTAGCITTVSTMSSAVRTCIGTIFDENIGATRISPPRRQAERIVASAEPGARRSHGLPDISAACRPGR